MSALDSTVPDRGEAARPAVGLAMRLVWAIGALIAKARESDYLRVDGDLRFRANQRRRTRVATRVGLLVIAAAEAFDALTLLGLDFAETRLAVAIDLTVLGVALVGWWSLGGRLHRHPELVAWAATIGLAISTVTTGTLVPSLAVQTVGYLFLFPGLVALLLPWRTRTHFRWLLAYSVIGFAYLAVGDLGRFSADERGDLVVVFTAAFGASLVGHVLLQRAQIRNFAQLGRIGSLRQKAESDMVELERLHHALELTARTDPLTGTGNRRRLEEDLRAVRSHIDRSVSRMASPRSTSTVSRGSTTDTATRRAMRFSGGSLRRSSIHFEHRTRSIDSAEKSFSSSCTFQTWRACAQPPSICARWSSTSPSSTSTMNRTGGCQ